MKVANATKVVRDRIVLARLTSHDGRRWIETFKYANRTQAERRARAMGPGWDIVRFPNGFGSGPWYVAKVLDPDPNKRTMILEMALISEAAGTCAPVQ